MHTRTCRLYVYVMRKAWIRTNRTFLYFFGQSEGKEGLQVRLRVKVRVGVGSPKSELCAQHTSHVKPYRCIRKCQALNRWG